MNSLISAPRLLENTIGSTDNDFVIAEWQDPGSHAGEKRLIAPLHLHRRDDEAWYVLEGTLRLQVGDAEVEAGAGAAVFVPRGTPHTYWNPGAGCVRYLLVMTSNIYRLIQEIHKTPDRNLATIRAIFEKHDSELLEA
jgi:mannose-6-phosphate isomerase-like protein (cupin superfamily)